MSEDPDDRHEVDGQPDEDVSHSTGDGAETGPDEGAEVADAEDGTERIGPKGEAGRPTDGESVEEGTDEVPLGAVADRLGDRGLSADDDLFGAAFEDVEADGIDGEALWADLQTELPSGLTEPESAEGDVFEVPQREYCGRCQFFSAPPDVACTYEGSEILAVVDTEHFRVEGCPIVLGEETLGDASR